MLKLIIIDDERATRTSLAENIEWDKLGISFMGDAEDGLLGLQLAKEVKPQIVLSDVRMPRMNGIEFAKELKKILPECKVIFLSGYSDKEYLKAAIQLQVVDYIEKPIDYDEVHAVLKKTVLTYLEDEEKRAENLNKVEQSVAMVKNDAALELIHRNADVAAIKKQFEKMGMNILLNENYISALVKINLHKALRLDGAAIKKEKINELMAKAFEDFSDNYLSGSIDNEHMVVHAYGRVFENILLLKGALKKFQDAMNEFYRLENLVTIGVGKPVRGAENVYQSYQTARKALQRMFLEGYDTILTNQEEIRKRNHFGYEVFADKIQQSLRNGAPEDAMRLLEELVAHIKSSHQTDVTRIKNVFLGIMLQILTKMKEAGIHSGDGDDSQELLWAERLNLYIMEEIRDFLMEKLMLLSEYYMQQKGKSKKIRAAMDYIGLNFSQGISVALIAEHVNMGQTYLCTQFKKETGRTLNEYIEEVRIEKAKEFLKDDSLKMEEVAKRVGYGNANYFASVFRKATGVYPSDFRRNFSL